MIHWGIIGYGRIAQRFEKGLSYSTTGKLYAIGTKSQYQKAMDNHPECHIYTDYDTLIHDENIDAIYIALPHKYHYIWAKKALLNHKAVLVEKPSTLSVDEIEELCEISENNNVFFMEAMKSRFVPMVIELKKLLNQGIIGDIISIENSFCYNVSYDDHSYLFDKEQGGALYDVGIYNIAMILDLVKKPLLDMKVEYIKKYDLDIDDKVTLIYDNCEVMMHNAIMSDYDTSMTIIGEKGKIVLSPFYRPTKITVIYLDGKIENYQKDYEFDDFYGEIEAVHQGMIDNRFECLEYSHKDMIQGIKIMKKAKEMML
ncbi:MAG: Gfo/Idh/MocA family oxidoreductase [Erysipelotrichaceae bacterium]|nr:Gfo/Idh/MocA family oxidoreductase [Erysipelotrichaceae bacterium]